MFNKPSWNNRKGGYLKPSPPSEQQKKQNLLEKMKAAVNLQKKETEPVQKMSLTEIAKQEHYDIDASIEEETKKRVKILPSKKGKFNPIVIPVQTAEKAVSVQKKSVEPVKEAITNVPIQEFMSALQIVLKYFDNANTQMTLLQEGVHQTDLETTDLLHSIELTEFDENEKSDMTDKIKEVRVRRRIQKRCLEYMTEINAYVDKNKQPIEALKTLKGKLSTIKEKQDNALYRPRIRTDLKQTKCIQG